MTEDHVQIKDKCPKKKNKVKIKRWAILLSKELKIMTITTMIKKLRRRMDRQNEKSDVFNKEIKNKENPKNIIIEI